MFASIGPAYFRRSAFVTLGAAALFLAQPLAAEPRDSNEAAPIHLAQASGATLDRLDAYESTIRELTGRVERLEHQVRQLSSRVEELESSGQSGAGDELDEAPSATYTPPDEEEAGAGGGARVLGTSSDSYSNGNEREESASSPEDEEGDQQAALPSGDAAAQYDHAFGLLRQAQWGEAESALEAFLEANPNHRLAGNAMYWLGETHYVRGDYVAAARVFAEAFQDYPDSGKAPDNLLKLGMSLGALDRRDDACGTLSELERRYDDAPTQILQRSRAERERLGC